MSAPEMPAQMPPEMQNEASKARASRNRPPDIAPRTFWSLISGAAGATIGWIASEVYIRVKMYDFDGAVENKVRNDIMNRQTGAGAGLSSAGNNIEHSLPSMGNFGPGVASHDLRMAHEYNLAQSGKYPFARFIKRFGTAPVAVGAAAVGGLVAWVGYLALAPKVEKAIVQNADLQAPTVEAEPARAVITQKTEREWAARVETAKDQPRAL